MKNLIFIILALSLSSCGIPKDEQDNNSPTSETLYLGCEPVPEDVPINVSPSCDYIVTGDWNSFEVKKDPSGVLSVQKTCGGQEGEHAYSQSQYDSQYVPAGSTSSDDFKANTGCVSASNVSGTGVTTINIWQQIP